MHHHLIGSSEHLDELIPERHRVVAWSMIVDHFALTIDDELGKVPRNFFGHVQFFAVEFTVLPEVLVQLTRILTVNLCLLKNREVDFIVPLGVLLDLLVGAWFLAAELIAREGENLESSCLKLGVKLN